MGKADLHIHTTASYDGTATVAATLEHVARCTDLDVIAITDHDTIDSALEACELATHYSIDVIPGVEVSTRSGHVLALFVERTPPRNLSLIETVEYIAELGGICIAAHPGGRWAGCLSDHVIQAALANDVVKRTLVGLEEYNASLFHLGANRRAFAMNQRFTLAAVGNSDSHMLWTIGQAYTYFPGWSAIDLRQALVAHTTSIVVQPRPWRFFPSFVKRQALRAFGLAQCAEPTPGSPITLGRLTGTNPLTYARQMIG
jgi:hypothetical protein